MKRILRTAPLLAIAAVLGCASVPITTTVVNQPGRRVTAEESTFSLFWLSPLPAETTSRLLDELVEQCPGGDLTGVTVGFAVGWAVVGQTERIVVSGYCVDPDPDRNRR